VRREVNIDSCLVERLLAKHVFNFHNGIMRLVEVNADACGLNHCSAVRLPLAHLAGRFMLQLIAVLRKSRNADHVGGKRLSGLEALDVQ